MKCTKEQFLKDVKDHKITVVKDDEVHRDIVFKRPESSTCMFRLTTWPGYLCISGDMGDYVFRRTFDMFDFFRSGKLEISEGYWHEKCTSFSRFGNGAKEFSQEKFKDYVKRGFREHVKSIIPTLNQRYIGKKIRDIWKDVNDHLIGCDNECDAMSALSTFESDGLDFQDFWEVDFKEYTYHYIWCLYAIVWGIQQYDALKIEEKAA